MRSAAATAHLAGHGVIDDLAGKLVTHRFAGGLQRGGKADLVSGEHRVFEFGAAPGERHATGDFLERLLDLQFIRLPGAAIAARPNPNPFARHLRRHYPIHHFALLIAADGFARRVHHDLHIGRPLAEAVVVRHQPRAGFQGKDARPHHQVDFGQQVDRQHVRLGDIGFMQIAFVKHRAVRHAHLGGIAVAQRHQTFVQIDAESARAVFFGCGDNKPPIARPQINQKIVRTHFGHFQHLVDHHLRRLHVRRVAVVLRRRRHHG